MDQDAGNRQTHDQPWGNCSYSENGEANHLDIGCYHTILFISDTSSIQDRIGIQISCPSSLLVSLLRLAAHYGLQETVLEHTLYGEKYSTAPVNY